MVVVSECFPGNPIIMVVSLSFSDDDDDCPLIPLLGTIDWVPPAASFSVLKYRVPLPTCWSTTTSDEGGRIMFSSFLGACGGILPTVVAVVLVAPSQLTILSTTSPLLLLLCDLDKPTDFDDNDVLLLLPPSPRPAFSFSLDTVIGILVADVVSGGSPLLPLPLDDLLR